MDPDLDQEGQIIADPPDPDSLFTGTIFGKNKPLYEMYSTVETKDKDSQNRKVPNLSLLSLLYSDFV
jgi:hypothetical protein